MPTTPNFGLHYPGATDPPCGDTAIQTLASDIDTALSVVRGAPWLAWGSFGLAAPVNGVATGASVDCTLTLTSQTTHNLFSLATPTTVATTQRAAYQVYLYARWQPGGTTPGATGGWVQTYLIGQPGGTVRLNYVARSAGHTWIDTGGCVGLHTWDYGETLGVRCQNSSTVTLNLNAMRMFLVRFSDWP